VSAGLSLLGPGAALAPALIESEVREQVRRRGMDPAAEPALMRSLVEQVLGDYEQRALVEDLPVLGDRLLAARLVFDAVAGFGPLQAYLDDPVVEEIWTNERLTGASPPAEGATRAEARTAPACWPCTARPRAAHVRVIDGAGGVRLPHLGCARPGQWCRARFELLTSGRRPAAARVCTPAGQHSQTPSPPSWIPRTWVACRVWRSPSYSTRPTRHRGTARAQMVLLVASPL